MTRLANDFSDLLLLDRDSLITLLERIQNETLLFAMIDCDEEVLIRVRSVLSNEGRKYLDQDLERYSPQHYQDSPLAQKWIIDVLNEMIERGEIAGLTKFAS